MTEVHHETPLYEDPLYWNGPKGYRPPGFCDFALNGVRAAHIATLVKSGRRILDFGCAFGYLVRRLRWRGYSAWGIDISRYAIDHAPEEVRLCLLCGGVRGLSFWPDENFDFIVSCGVFEHLDEADVTLALREFKRLAPRGLISLAVEDAAKPQHEDEGHDLLRPLSWWEERMPPGYTVMDDDTKAWLAVQQDRTAYLVQIMLKAQRDDPALQILGDCLSRRGYKAWAANDETAYRITAPNGQEAYVVPDLVVPYISDLDLRLLNDRIAASGVDAVVDEIVKSDEVARGRTRWLTSSRG